MIGNVLQWVISVEGQVVQNVVVNVEVMFQNNVVGEIDNDVGLLCVINKKVLISDVKIVQKIRMFGCDLCISENQVMIIVGERNCSIVVVVVFDFLMVSKKVSCIVSVLIMEKISRLMVFL